MKDLLQHLIVNYRWLFVLVLLPISVVYKVFLFVRNWIAFHYRDSKKSHEENVRYVQKQILEWNKSGRKKQLCTNRPGWMTISFYQPKYKATMHRIDVDLKNILGIDIEKRVVRLEPMVTMGQITSHLLPLGWTLAVVPELDDLTIGGLVMGTGIETSSHRYGLFQQICNEYEMVLADGSVIRCSAEENKDLFHAIPWSHGTLGFLVSVEVQIVPAKKYVRVHYKSTFSTEELINRLRFETMRKDASEFVECLMFDKERSVVMSADMTDIVEKEKINKIGKWYKPWFYKHVETYLRKTDNIEFIPLVDYYHRHSKSLFWVIQHIIPFGNHFLFRWLLGWTLPIKISLLKLTEAELLHDLYEQNHVFQDMLVPLDTLHQSIKFFDETVKIYPLWICPALLAPNLGFVHPDGDSAKMYVDIGVFGEPQVSYQAKTTTRKLEEYVRSIKGFQLLYAATYMNRDEFRRMFDHTLYDKVRKQLNCNEAFPEVYDKVRRSARK
ncbi:delta(24)-sterol reductase-like [Centruroides sculpturatus]|uniref:delta(24)-sterol reductase-like n=1 Tax=Centruroides sculpturatus TaxID=218467 RepID=UPI000C6E2E60|nr:delta(24)-sterol reductase-like [Centruroides sculpturatus]